MGEILGNIGENLENIVEIDNKFPKIDDRLSVEDIVFTSTIIKISAIYRPKFLIFCSLVATIFKLLHMTVPLLQTSIWRESSNRQRIFRVFCDFS